MSFFMVIIIILVVIFTALLIGIYEKNTNAVCMSKKRLDGKTTLITGGTAGMGLEIAKDFAQRGARVIIASPFKHEGLQAVQNIVEDSENQNIVFKFLDLASIKSVRKLAADILGTEDRLDILINNAGVGGPNGITKDGLNFIVQVNYYGAFLLTVLLLPLLRKTGRSEEPSRIVNVASVAHFAGRVVIENLDSHLSFPQLYANSKLYLVLFSRALTKRLQDSRVVINNADPGAVGTNIFRTFNRHIEFCWFIFWVLYKSPWFGAQTTIHVALDKKAGAGSGEYFKNCKRVRAMRTVYDEKLAALLWDKSIKLMSMTDKELEECFTDMK